MSLSDEEGPADRNRGLPDRYRPPLVHGLLIALGFLAAWYGPGLVGVLEPSTDGDPGSPDALKGLGYLSGLEEPPEDTGVLVHTNRAQPGYNLWTSGHRPAVYLSDLNGNVRHRWSVRFRDAFPDADLPPETYEVVSRDFIRKFHPYPDGSLLVMFTPYGMVKLGRDSRIQWSVEDVNHHDVAVAGDTIYSLTNDLKTVTHKGRTRTRIVDFITAYDTAGRRQRSWSILEAIRGSDFEALLGYVHANEGDMTHANSLKILPDGHALLSLLTPNAIVKIDLTENRVVWGMAGRTDKQHDARLLPDGTLMVFDNGVYREESRIVVFDRPTQKQLWTYGRREGERFYTRCCGTAQPLGNGNVLITSTYEGRVFEVTREGEVVWEFLNPHVTDEGKVGAIFEMERYPKQYFEGLELESVGRN